MIYHCNHNCYNVSQQPAVDEISKHDFLAVQHFFLVVLILSKINFMIVPFFDSGFSRYCKMEKLKVGMIRCEMSQSFMSKLIVF